ncbi:MAG: hypothetical protein IKX48_09375 [Victivallales bacterium]|nr:hypothetical protein [Victivallales bacterium]
MKHRRIFLLTILLLAIHSFALQAAEQAPDSLFQRYGREDYATLKEEIFQKLPDGLTPNQTVDAVKIFKMANDMDTLVSFIERLDPKQLPDQKTWYQIFHVIQPSFGKRDLAMEALVLKSPFIYVNKSFDINYFSQEYEQEFKNCLNTDGKEPSPRQIEAIKKLMEHSPAYYARMADCFPEECPVIPKLTDVLRKESSGPKRHQAVERMTWRVLHSNRYNRRKLPEINEKEVHEFTELLNKENIEEFLPYIDFCQRFEWYQEAIPYLEKWQDQPMTDFERKNASRMSSTMLTPEMLISLRHNYLISFLLKVGRKEDAQKALEKYYGADMDINKISIPSTWRHLGAVQAETGGNTFRKKLDQAQPPAEGSLAFFMQKSAYLDGRTHSLNIQKDNGKSREEVKKELDDVMASFQKLYDDAIQHGRKNSDYPLLVWGLTHKSGDNREETFNYAQEAWRLAREHLTLEEIEKSVSDGKHGRADLFNIRNDAVMRYAALLKEKGDIKEWCKTIRREIMDGFYNNTLYEYEQYLSNGNPNQDFTIAANDEIYQNILDKSFLKKHQNGFEFHEEELHCFRLKHVPMHPLIGDGFEECLKQAIAHDKAADELLHSRGWSRGNNYPSFLFNVSQRLHGKDAEAKRHLIYKYIYDCYPEGKYNLAESLPARSYEEGKQLAERDWNAHEMEPYVRKSCLRQLLKMAPSDAEREWCKAELKKLNASVE